MLIPTIGQRLVYIGNHYLATAIIHVINWLTLDDRANVLIVDDSLYDRGRSKKVELLSRSGFNSISLKTVGLSISSLHRKAPFRYSGYLQEPFKVGI